MGFGESTPRKSAAHSGEQKTNMLLSCTWFFGRARLQSEIFETLSTP